MTVMDRAVLMTRANRGVGEALRTGAKRVCAGTRQPLAHLDGRVTPLTPDVTNAAQTQAAVERVESLDVLINNAGLGFCDDLSDRAALERHSAVNLLGTYGVAQAFLPLLTRSRGAIVSVLSVTGFAALPLVPPIRSQRRPRSPCHNRCALSTYRSLLRVRRASHLRRSGEGGGGDLPRSHVRVHGRELAQRCGQGGCGQGARAPVAALVEAASVKA
jgi:hypothetical protein